MNKLRFVAKSVVHGAVELSGRARRRRLNACGKLVVLTYHSFSKGWPKGLVHSLPVRRFEKQLKFLKKNFHVASLTEGVRALERGEIRDKPWLAITIDDGFGDNYEHAFPILKNLKIPATVFLATDFMDTGRLPWPTRLVEILESTAKLEMNSPIQSRLDNRERRGEAARRLKALYAPLPPTDRFEALNELQRDLGVEQLSERLPLSWGHVREMQSNGIEFGSHTVYHSTLPEVSPLVISQELVESKKRLETELDESCVSFAYPDGKHNKETLKALQAAGYRIALTQDFGWNSATTNRLALHRIEVPFHDPLPTFRCRVSSALRGK